MKLFEINKTVNKAYEIAENIKDYQDPEILFILVDRNKSKNNLVLGISDCNEYSLYDTAKKKITAQDEIILQHSDFFDSSIGGYVIEALEDGYELVYMKLMMHVMLWDFIDSWIDDISYFSKGLYSYLRFCIRTGITHTLLVHYSGCVLNDIYSVFVEQMVDDYKVLLSEYIGQKRTVLAYQKRFIKNKTSYIYRVMVIDSQNLDIEFNDYHSRIENAFADYNNHFFALSLSYYQSKETDNNKLVEDFKQTAVEPLY